MTAKPSNWDGFIPQVLVVLFIFATLAIPGFLFNRDDYGWEKHTVESTVAIPGQWLRGERRTCHLWYERSEAHPLAIPRELTCGDGLTDDNSHRFDVVYQGRVNRKETTDWDCARTDDSIYCRAVD